MVSRFLKAQPDDDRRADVVHGRGLRELGAATVVVMALALALVFFWVPLEAEQGFLQKIFYVHVPLAIVALFGFVGGGFLAIKQLRTRELGLAGSRR